MESRSFPSLFFFFSLLSEAWKPLRFQFPSFFNIGRRQEWESKDSPFPLSLFFFFEILKGYQIIFPFPFLLPSPFPVLKSRYEVSSSVPERDDTAFFLLFSSPSFTESDPLFFFPFLSLANS